MLSSLSPEFSPKSHNFSTVKKFFVEKTFDRYLLFDLFSVFGQNSLTLFKNCYFIVIFQKLTKISCLTALV